MSCFQNEVVIRRRVRGGEPALNVPLQLVTYKILSVLITKGGRKTTNVSPCSFLLKFGEERLQTQVCKGDSYYARDTYPDPAEYYLLMPSHLTKQVLSKISAANHANFAYLP